MDSTKAEKIEMIFLIKDKLKMRNSLTVRHLISGVLWTISKSVCINNHIKEIFTVQFATDMWLSSI